MKERGKETTDKKRKHKKASRKRKRSKDGK
jgi:hypothetical protein